MSHANAPNRAAALLLAVSAAYIGASVLQPAGLYDEGLIVSGASRILHGQHPYADFNSGYPPGPFYTIAAVFRMFGETLLAARIWDAVWRAATVAAALWLARESAPKRARLLPVACCAALSGAVEYHLYPMITATLPCLAALAALLAYDRTGRPRWALLSGALLGCTALYRHDLAAVAGVVAVASMWRKPRGIVPLLGGAAAVAGPAVAYLFSTVPASQLKEAFLDFLAKNAAARLVPLPHDVVPLVRDLLLPAAIAVYAIVVARNATARVLGAVGLLAGILSIQRLDTVHAFPALVISLVLLSGLAPSVPQRALVALAFLFYGVLPAAQWALSLRSVFSTPASGVARAGPVRLAADTAASVRYLETRLASGDPLYVGTTSHSRISVNDALSAFLLDRRQPTRFDMWLPGDTNAAPAQTATVAALERQAVPYVLLYHAPLLEEPNLSSVDSGVRLVDDYLARRYRPVEAFGRYRILRRVP